MPAIEARMPITSASTMIDQSTCLREAPSVRSVASSRVRCAIVIESEFAITNAPTKSAMTAEREQEVWRKLRKPSMSFASSFAWASPVRTCVPGGRIARICAGELLGRDSRLSPSRGSGRACRLLSKSRCAVGRSKPASVAPPRLDAPPNLTRPEMRILQLGPVRLDADRVADLESPSCRRSDLSMTTSFAFGHLPSTSVSELRSGLFGSTLKPRFGAPPKMITLPFLPIRCASPPTPPTAWSTSGSLPHLGEQRLVEGRRRSCCSRSRGRTPPGR